MSNNWWFGDTLLVESDPLTKLIEAEPAVLLQEDQEATLLVEENDRPLLIEVDLFPRVYEVNQPGPPGPPGGGGFLNPMTTPGDLIEGGAGGTATRLGIGAASQVLHVNPITLLLEYIDPPGLQDPMTSAGDLVYRDGSNVTARLPVGATGKTLQVGAGLPAWVYLTRTIQIVLDGASAPLTAGDRFVLPCDFPFTITGVTLLADVSGSVVLDLLKTTYASYTGIAGGSFASICASARPTITSAVKSQDLTLTGWTTAVAAGAVLKVAVISCSTITKVTLGLRVQI